MEGSRFSLGQGQTQSHVSSSQLHASHGSLLRVASAETEAVGMIGTSSLGGRRPVDPNMDPKKLKRTLANRQYSQKNRLKKLHHVAELEGKVKALQDNIDSLSPQLKELQLQCSLKRRENISMQRKISDLTGKLWFQEDLYNELKKQRDILKSEIQILQQQQQQEEPGIMAPTDHQPGVNYMVNLEYPSQPMCPGLTDGYSDANTLPNMNWEQSDPGVLQASDVKFFGQNSFQYNF